MPDEGTPSYHDLYITTAQIPRTRLFNLPFGVQVSCDRTAGWRVWGVRRPVPGRQFMTQDELLAGEYDGPDKWLVLDVAGSLIVDSRRNEAGSA